MNTPARILLIEDDPSLAGALQRVLGDDTHEVILEKRGDEGLARAQRDPFDLVITDLRLPGLNGLELVKQLHVSRPRLPIILMTAHGTTETAIEATKSGAFDYLLKPFEMEELLLLTEKAIHACRLMTEQVELGQSASPRASLVGQSRGMQEIYKEIGRIAAKPVTVLIRGETGTGKELIARAIYQHSERGKAPFIAINCAAIPETLLESELFGHERGAFTGADARRIGRFEQALGGTLFLDEIGDMTPSTQVKLLRVLQDNSIHRLGGRDTIPVDVRVIAATHRNLESAIQQKQFREDLYYRLNVVAIHLPPLRERRDDIPELIQHFLQKYSTEFGTADGGIQPDAIQLLAGQPWLGNVRELENVIRKVLLQARGYAITADHVQVAIARTPPSIGTEGKPMREIAAHLLAAAQRGELADARARFLEIAEREIIRQAIQLAGGNQAKAARWLGLSRLTTREKLLQFGLHPNQDPPKV